MRIGIVLTSCTAGAPLASFIKYHLAVGFSHIFLFYEGNEDSIIEDLPDTSVLTIVRRNAALEREWLGLRSFAGVKDFLGREVMARQILNAEYAIVLAKHLGLQWLLHIDVDELFYGPELDVCRHFSQLERQSVSHCIYLNHEAVPESFEVTDWFREVTLFKTNPRALARKDRALDYIAYESGKAAVRLDSDPVPHGVHRFVTRPGSGRAVQSEKCQILHYPSCGFGHFVSKYRTLGNFANSWFDRVSIVEKMRFHATARDLIMADRLEEARRLYCDRVMLARLSSADRSELLQAGNLLRIREPAGILSQNGEASSDRTSASTM